MTLAVYSNDITVTGIDDYTDIAIAGGGVEYSVNGGVFTAHAGTVFEGDTVAVQLTSSQYFSTTVSTVVTIGGIPAVFL